MQNKKQTMPKIEDVKIWVKKDIDSAIYLLSTIRQRHPEILDSIAEEIYNKATSEEQGAAIDQLKK